MANRKQGVGQKQAAKKTPKQAKKKTAMKKPSSQPSEQPPNDRELAQWVLQQSGKVRPAGSEDYIDAVADLPPGDFSVLGVDFQRADIGDSGMEQLSGLARLEELDISSTDVTNAGLAHLKGLTSLRSLDVRDTAVTDEGIENLKSALPDLLPEYDIGHRREL